MPSSIARRSTSPFEWRGAASRIALGVISLATLTAGAMCLIWHAAATSSENVLAPSGAVLLISGLFQMYVGLRHWRTRGRAATELPLLTLRFCRAALAVAFVAYLSTLAIGPIPFVAFTWLSAVAAGYALLLYAATFPFTLPQSWQRAVRGAVLRRLVRLSFGAMIVLIAAEAGLQAYRAISSFEWFHPPDMARLDEPDPTIRDIRDASYDPQLRFSFDRFRVAVLGDEAILGSAAGSGYLTQIQQMFPGLEVVPISGSQHWTPDQRASLAARLSGCRPDLVLTMLAVCEDIATPASATNWFDWRQLAIFQVLGGREPLPVRPVTRAMDATDEFEPFLAALAPQLTVCRTPMDAAMRSRWQQTFAALDNWLATCRELRVPTALVLVPGEFQVNRGLGDTLRRRAGYAAEQLDMELPQRRWVGYAEHRRLPVLDLLPYLRLCRQSPYRHNATVWNETGDNAAAGAIGGWLQSRYGGQLALAAQLSSAP